MSLTLRTLRLAIINIHGLHSYDIKPLTWFIVISYPFQLILKLIVQWDLPDLQICFLSLQQSVYLHNITWAIRCSYAASMDSNFDCQMLQNSLICDWVNLPFYDLCFPSFSCFAKMNELFGDYVDQLVFYYTTLIMWGKLLT